MTEFKVSKSLNQRTFHIFPFEGDEEPTEKVDSLCNNLNSTDRGTYPFEDKLVTEHNTCRNCRAALRRLDEELFEEVYG